MIGTNTLSATSSEFSVTWYTSSLKPGAIFEATGRANVVVVGKGLSTFCSPANNRSPLVSTYKQIIVLSFKFHFCREILTTILCYRYILYIQIKKNDWTWNFLFFFFLKSSSLDCKTTLVTKLCTKSPYIFMQRTNSEILASLMLQKFKLQVPAKPKLKCIANYRTT